MNKVSLVVAITACMGILSTANAASYDRKELASNGESTGQILFISKVACKGYSTPQMNKTVSLMKKKFGRYSTFNNEMKSNYNYMNRTMAAALAREPKSKTKQMCSQLESQYKAINDSIK